MSAVTRFPVELGYAGLRMTADEYLALGETPERYELIEGLVFMSPSPRPRHNQIVLRTAAQLLAFADRAGKAVVFSETDVRFAPGTVYRPDVCAYRSDRMGGSPRRLTIPPDLIVEVLSDGTKALDLITKRADYERLGVGEYWTIDTDTTGVRCWRRRGVKFVEEAATDASLASEAIPGFVLDLAHIRDNLPIEE